ncbi:hypothetical protein PMAYCL1PPCAC_02996, partial [Pristionchus mayeri]
PRRLPCGRLRRFTGHSTTWRSHPRWMSSSPSLPLQSRTRKLPSMRTGPNEQSDSCVTSVDASTCEDDYQGLPQRLPTQAGFFKCLSEKTLKLAVFAWPWANSE